jgi:hypothetical protein
MGDVLLGAKMKTCVAISVALLLAMPCVGGPGKAKATGKPDRVLSKGEWELQIFYRAKGTRSEGQHGVLTHKGKPIPPGKEREEKDTPLGVMLYYGNEYNHPFDITGWNFKNPADILHSRSKKHPAEQSPAGASLRATPLTFCKNTVRIRGQSSILDKIIRTSAFTQAAERLGFTIGL